MTTSRSPAIGARHVGAHPAAAMAAELDVRHGEVRVVGDRMK
jgi:hypothetical protein